MPILRNDISFRINIRICIRNICTWFFLSSYIYLIFQNQLFIFNIVSFSFPLQFSNAYFIPTQTSPPPLQFNTSKINYQIRDQSIDKTISSYFTPNQKQKWTAKFTSSWNTGYDRFQIINDSLFKLQFHRRS